MSNLYTNGSFESGLTGWSNNASTLTHITNDATDGTSCVEVATNATATGGLRAPDVGIAPNQELRLAFDIKGEGPVRVYWNERSATSSSLATVSSPNIAVSGDWMRVTHAYTIAQPTAAFLRVYIGTPTATAITFRVDDVVLVSVSTTTAPRPSRVLTPGPLPLTMLTPH